MSFLGIDIGTSTLCAVVYDTTTKKISSLTRPNDSGLSSPHAWEKTQQPTLIIDRVRELIHTLRHTYPDIRGIGLSGQMHGILYVDAEGRAISPLYTWQDARGSLPYRDGESYAGWLSARTGLSLSPGFGLVTHFYNQVNGLVPEGTAKLCTIMDYVAMQLTDRRQPLTDYSIADSLGFFDKKRLAFDKEALKKAGLDEAILPEIAPAPALAGYHEAIPVYAAIGDNQASFLGSVRDIPYSIHITVGTSSQLSVYSDTYLEAPSLDTRPLPGGGYILVGAALCGGCSFALLKNFFSETVELCTGKKIEEDALYRAMLSVPYQKDEPDDLQVETLFDGTRRSPEKRGKITRISRQNWTPGQLILGFLKGMSRELHDFYRLLPPAAQTDKTLLVGSGNGLKKNPLLGRILEEDFRLPLQVSACREEAAFGACLCGMVGAGYLPDFAAFGKEND